MASKRFDRFAAEFLDLVRPPLRTKGTSDKYRQVLRELHAAADPKTTRDINPRSIALWVAAHQDRAKATNHSLLRSLRAACHYARVMRYLSVDPFEWRSPTEWLQYDERPRAETAKHFNFRQLLAILAQADDEAASGSWQAARLQALVYVYAHTGIRKKEALGALKTDFDLENFVVHIRANSKRRLKTPKGDGPRALPRRAADVLARWFPRTSCEWAFPGARCNGPWLSGGPGVRALDQVKALALRAGVTCSTIQMFRHTLGTLGESMGLSELEMQRQLRHTRPRTQDHYRHPDLDVIRGIAGKIRFEEARA